MGSLICSSQASKTSRAPSGVVARVPAAASEAVAASAEVNEASEAGVAVAAYVCGRVPRRRRHNVQGGRGGVERLLSVPTRKEMGMGEILVDTRG